MLTGAIKFTKNLDFIREIKIVKIIEKVTNTEGEWAISQGSGLLVMVKTEYVG